MSSHSVAQELHRLSQDLAIASERLVAIARAIDSDRSAPVLTAPAASPDRLLTVPEVMDLLQLGRTNVYDLIRRGELESVLIGRARRIPTKAVSDLIASSAHVEPVAH